MTTLRDWFAGQVLPVILREYSACSTDHALIHVPALAYRWADAMLAERDTNDHRKAKTARTPIP